MNKSPSNSYSADFRQLQSLVPYVSGPIVDQARIGTFGFAAHVTVPAANAEFTVTHPLGRKPEGYIIVRSTKGGTVYDPTDGSDRWDTHTLKLRGTVASDIITLLLI